MIPFSTTKIHKYIIMVKLPMNINKMRTTLKSSEYEYLQTIHMFYYGKFTLRFSASVYYYKLSNI